MNIIEFLLFAFLSPSISLILNRCLIKIKFSTWGVLVSLTYNVLMIALYLDTIENKKLFRLQLDQSAVEHHTAISIISMIMVFFHSWAFRNEK